MKRLNWLWFVGFVGLAGCTQLAGLGSYTYDLDDEKGGEGGIAGAAGATGGAGGIAGAAGATGGAGGIAGAAGATGGTGGIAGAAGANGGEGGIAGAAGATGGTGGATGGEGGTGGCPTGCGVSEQCCGALEECGVHGYCVAKSVPMPKGYSIDATEVTRSQYESWLAKDPPTEGQPKSCQWNEYFAPDSFCMSSSDVCQGSNCGNHPIVCVDWCDAHAYCEGVGKRLCGKIGGGANASGDYKNASTSQWYAACSSGGTNKYPYGGEYDGETCKGVNAGVGTTSEVGSFLGCQSSVSGYEGVYDMSGNVWEWEDSCIADEENNVEKDKCRMRGGSYLQDNFGLPCDHGNGSYRNGSFDYIGFRCCS